MTTTTAATTTQGRSGGDRDRRDRRAVELLDGGTGEELFRRGLPDDRKIWSAAALVHPQHHALLVDVHRAFLEAGADFITCNNYGVTPGVGFDEAAIARYAELSGQLAHEARATTTATRTKTPARVCGSLPPLLESYRPDRLTDFDHGVHLYALIGQALHGHVDLFLAETLSTIQEAKMAITGVRDLRKPVMISFVLNTKGQLRSGQDVDEAIRELLQFTKFHATRTPLYGVLFNCSLPEAITKALAVIHSDDDLLVALEERDVRLGAYANRLTEIPDDWALDAIQNRHIRDMCVDTHKFCATFCAPKCAASSPKTDTEFV